MRGIVGRNYTPFFNRELFMYSLGDIRFSKPVSLKKVAYTTAFFIVWTIPLILIFGMQFNVYFAFFAVGVPLILGSLAVRKIFFGKTMVEFFSTLWRYMQEPRGWTDLKGNQEMGRGVYRVEKEIWIGRRREMQVLALQEEEELRAKNSASGATDANLLRAAKRGKR